MSSTVFTDGVTLTAASWFQAVDNVTYQYLSGVAGTNTITATGPSGLGAYAAGLKFRFIPAATNTGATTINITGASALGARNIFAGGAALLGGELRIGIPCELIDDGTQFQLAAPSLSTGTWTPSIGGTATYTTQTGTWTRIGRLIYVDMNLVINVRGTGDQNVISGLPFAALKDGGLMVSDWQGSNTAIIALYPQLNAGASTITLRGSIVAVVTLATPTIFTNGTTVKVAGCYVTAA